MADPPAPGSPTKARISPAALASSQLRSFHLAYLAFPGVGEEVIHHCLGHPFPETLPPRGGCIPVSLCDKTATVLRPSPWEANQGRVTLVWGGAVMGLQKPRSRDRQVRFLQLGAGSRH